MFVRLCVVFVVASCFLIPLVCFWLGFCGFVGGCVLLMLRGFFLVRRAVFVFGGSVGSLVFFGSRVICGSLVFLGFGSVL